MRRGRKASHGSDESPVTASVLKARYIIDVL